MFEVFHISVHGLNVKMEIYNVITVSVVLYDSEALCHTK
jgi:hypothetical protein